MKILSNLEKLCATEYLVEVEKSISEVFDRACGFIGLSA